MTSGTLPASALRQLVADGHIKAESGIAEDQVQPASLDLVLAAEAYRMPGAFWRFQVKRCVILLTSGDWNRCH